jgi:hypothetical protein
MLIKPWLICGILADTHRPGRGVQLKPSEGPPFMSPVEQHTEAEEAHGGVPENHAPLLLGFSQRARREVSLGGTWLFLRGKIL